MNWSYGISSLSALTTQSRYRQACGQGLAKASALSNTKVLCISRDLPFAQKRFCGAEGLENVINLSDFNTGSFGKDYGLEITDSVLAGLHSRVVIVLDENGVVKYTDQVPEIADEPNYENALAAL